MQSLRAERLAFYNEQLPAIRQEMEMDEVSPEVRAQWMDEMQVKKDIREMRVEDPFWHSSYAKLRIPP